VTTVRAYPAARDAREQDGERVEVKADCAPAAFDSVLEHRA
jgi:hypothetical protein